MNIKRNYYYFNNPITHLISIILNDLLFLLLFLINPKKFFSQK